VIDPSVYNSLRYRTTARPSEVLADLPQIDTIRTDAEKNAAAWFTALFVWIGVLVVLFLITIGASTPAIVPMVVIIVGIVGGILINRARQKQIERIPDPRRYQLPARLLRHLACDMAPDASVTIEVDLNHYRQQQYHTTKGPAGRYTLTVYTLPWLVLEGELLDGSRFRLTTTQHVKRKSRSRGKKGEKVKEVLWEEINLTVRGKGLRDARLEPWSDILGTVPLPEGVFLKKAETDQDRVHVRLETHRQHRETGIWMSDTDVGQKLANADAHLVLFVGCYHALGKCRTRRRA
jgi:hypothetical protein